MGLVEAFRTCVFQKYATFQGRASRSEYWYFVLGTTLGYVVVALLLGLISGITGAFEPGADPIGGYALLGIIGILFLGLLIPAIAVSVRRLHDRDMSGWWYLGFLVLSTIPFVSALVSIGMLFLFCLKGTEGPNRFGGDPLGVDSGREVLPDLAQGAGL